MGVGSDATHIRLGALLNLPGEPRLAEASGRGFIVADYLTGTESNTDYSDKLTASDVHYSAFNFVSIEFE